MEKQGNFVNILIKNEEIESKFDANNILIKLEPLDSVDPCSAPLVQTCHNVYDSHIEVVKNELPDNNLKIEQDIDNEVRFKHKITMKREKLIEEVRKYSYLYDLSDAKYSDNAKKDEAWKQISIKLKQSESKCKKTWLNLRESHRRAIKKRKTKSGQAATATKKWTFEDEMSFLLPHYRERNTISSVNDDDGSDVSSFLDNDDLHNSVNLIHSPENLQPETSALSSRPKTSASSVTSNIPKKSKKSYEIEHSSASHTLMKYLLDEKVNKEEDDIDTFFKSIAATVKKFSEYNQAVIKSKIYNAVSEMELKEIADKQSYYSYGNPYIPQRQDHMPRGYSTPNKNSHENQSMSTTTGASNTDDFNISNLGENSASNTVDFNKSNNL